MHRLLPFILMLVAMLAAPALAEERFPPPEFRSGYAAPPTQTQLPATRTPLWQYVDVAALGAALGLAAYFTLKKRSRRGVFVLLIACLIYFGFWRKGCVCAIGGIQNITYAAFHPEYALPWVVAAYFLLPLVFSLFFGRVFCAGVCPLGAIQDAVLWRPLQLPKWIDAGLGLFAYAYLGLAVLFAATGSDFVICEYDPFVGFFRLSGPAHMLFLGAMLLIGGLFVGRFYCRFICPYGVLLRMLAPFAKWRVSITPDRCIDCRLCEQACPFGAIRQPARREKVSGKRATRIKLILAAAMIAALPAIFAWLGYRSGPAVANADSTVQLAKLVQAEESGATGRLTSTQRDRLEAFHRGGQTREELFRDAAAMQHRFAVGMAWIGAWMGLVIGCKLAARHVRRGSSEYIADAGTCFSCARCYKLCPVEQPGGLPQRGVAR